MGGLSLHSFSLYLTLPVYKVLLNLNILTFYRLYKIMLIFKIDREERVDTTFVYRILWVGRSD